MKILITVNTYYPHTDGVQSVTQYLAEGLANRGHKVTVVTATQHGNLSEEYYHNIHIIRENIYVKHAIYFGEKNHYINLIKNISNEHEVMINVCTQNPMTDLLLGELKNIKCKKVLYMHGMCEFIWTKKNFASLKEFGHKILNNMRWQYLYRRYAEAFQLYDCVVQIHKSEYGVKFMKKRYGIDCEIIENAAEDIFFEEEKKRRIEELPDKYFVMVANYLSGKNQEFVLRAFYKAKVDTDIAMVFIGNSKTTYYDKLKQEKKNLDIIYGYRTVYFLVDIERNKIPSFVANAELYLMGSKVEKFPISIIEAMACGTPYISTDVGCVKYLPGGVVVKSEEEMSKKITEIMSNIQLKESLAKEGERYACDNLKIGVKVEQLEHLLFEI